MTPKNGVYRFAKSQRLRKSWQFKKTLRMGRRWQSTFLSIQALPGQSDLRLGITVTRKFGKAHKRNRFKRLIRELFRTSANRLPPNTWLHVRPQLQTSPSYSQLREQFAMYLEFCSGVTSKIPGSRQVDDSTR